MQGQPQTHLDISKDKIGFNLRPVSGLLGLYLEVGGTSPRS